MPGTAFEVRLAESLDRPWALLQMQGDGSFFYVGAPWKGVTMVRVEFNAVGRLSVLVMNGTEWREAALRFGRARDRRKALVQLRTARAAENGGIEARKVKLSSGGRRRFRELHIDARGERTWTVRDERKNGSRLEGEGRFADGTATVTRRRIDPAGSVTWESKSTAQYEQRRDAAVAGRVSVEAEKVFSGGGSKRSQRIAFADERGRFSQREVKFSNDSIVGADAKTTTHHIWPNQLGETVVSVTKYPDGSEQITTVVETSPGAFSPVGVPSSKEKTTIGVSSNGSSGVVAHQKETSKSEGNGGASGSWDKTVITDGKTIGDKGSWSVDKSGNSSATTVVYHADGSVTITTRTVDASGTGTVHTTTTDEDGNVTDDTTEDVSEDDSDSDTDAGSDTDDADADTDSDDGDSEPDDGGGGDADMGWEDEDEGPPRTLPTHTGSIFDYLNDPETWGASSEDDEAPPSGRLAARLRRLPPRMPTTSGDLGHGEGGGESPPTLRLEGLDASGESVDPPTEDWGDWNHPQVHIAFTHSLLSGLAKSSAVDASQVSQALVACSALAAQVQAVASQHP